MTVPGSPAIIYRPRLSLAAVEGLGSTGSGYGTPGVGDAEGRLPKPRHIFRLGSGVVQGTYGSGMPGPVRVTKGRFIATARNQVAQAGDQDRPS